MIIQYPVIKLGWIFDQASSIMAVQGAIMLLTYWVLLPTYTRLGIRHLGNAASASFAIMLGGPLVLATGAVITGLGETAAIFFVRLTVYTFREGPTVAINVHIDIVVDKSSLAQVMAVLSMAATCGKGIASGAFPNVLALGLDTGVEELIGLPVLVAAGLFVVARVCVLGARIWSGTKGGKAVVRGAEDPVMR